MGLARRLEDLSIPLERWEEVCNSLLPLAYFLRKCSCSSWLSEQANIVADSSLLLSLFLEAGSQMPNSVVSRPSYLGC
jgi:hypothetical protein